MSRYAPLISRKARQEGETFAQRTVMIAFAGPIGERRARRELGHAPFRVIAAYHEAAHAAVADLVAYHVWEVSIIPDYEDRSGGHMLYHPAKPRPDKQPEETPGGDDPKGKEPREKTPSDERTISTFCQLLAASRGLGIGWKPALTVAREMRSQTSAMVDHLWPAVHQLAQVVIEENVITGEVAREILIAARTNVMRQSVELEHVASVEESVGRF